MIIIAISLQKIIFLKNKSNLMIQQNSLIIHLIQDIIKEIIIRHIVKSTIYIMHIIIQLIKYDHQ